VLFRLWEPPGADLPDPAWVPDRAGGTHLLVGRHADVRRVLADPRTYRPDNALDAVTPIPVAAMRILARHGFRLPPTLANNGTPSHPAIREAVSRALHPVRTDAQRSWLTGLVRRRVTALSCRIRAGQPVDLYADLTADLPLLVLARLVDLPTSEVAVVRQFSRAALELFWAPLDVTRQRDLARIVGDYHARLRLFATTGTGMVGRLRDDGHPPDVIVGALFFLLVAGQETTSQFLTLLLHRLIDEPQITAGLVHGRVAADDVVEEGLRLDSPIVSWRRVAAADTTLGGVPVPAGTSIVLWLSRAGRDPSVVVSPDRFVPGQRGSRRHVAFGSGAHRCIGATLSRMEASIVVSEAAPMLRQVTVLKRPSYSDNLSFRIPDTLLVTAAAADRRNLDGSKVPCSS
jgi:cytochrome P450